MARFVRSKWLVASVFMAAVSVAGLVAFISTRAPAAPAESAAVPVCGNCEQQEDIPNRTLPDGTLHPETAARFGELEQQRKAQREEAREKALQRFNAWHGTKGLVAESVPAADRPLFNAVAQVFGGDPPAPEQRLVYFASFMEGQPQYKCVGWSTEIVSVTPNDNGWEATVHVRPQLAPKEGGGALYTPGFTIEKWQVEPNGSATPIDVQFGDGRGVIFVD